MARQTEARRVPVERLSGFIERAFTALGMPAADARTVASLMAEAERRAPTATASSACRTT